MLKLARWTATPRLYCSIGQLDEQEFSTLAAEERVPVATHGGRQG
jgi:hypothetical protein